VAKGRRRSAGGPSSAVDLQGEGRREAAPGGDAPAALLLIEHVLAAAHGYAGLFVGGFLSRRVTEPTEIAARVEAITRALARDAAGDSAA
jgi:hypothetical protein